MLRQSDGIFSEILTFTLIQDSIIQD